MFKRLLNRIDNRDDTNLDSFEVVYEIYKGDSTPKEDILLEGLPGPKVEKSEEEEEEDEGEKEENLNEEEKVEGRVSKVFSFLFGGSKNKSNPSTPSTPKNGRNAFDEDISKESNNNDDDDEKSSLNTPLGAPSINIDLQKSEKNEEEEVEETKIITESVIPPKTKWGDDMEEEDAEKENTENSKEEFVKIEKDDVVSIDDMLKKEKEWIDEKDFFETKVKRLENFQRQTMKKMREINSHNDHLQGKLKERSNELIDLNKLKEKVVEENKKLKKRLMEVELENKKMKEELENKK